MTSCFFSLCHGEDTCKRGYRFVDCQWQFATTRSLIFIWVEILGPTLVSASHGWPAMWPLASDYCVDQSKDVSRSRLCNTELSPNEQGASYRSVCGLIVAISFHISVQHTLYKSACRVAVCRIYVSTWFLGREVPWIGPHRTWRLMWVWKKDRCTWSRNRVTGPSFFILFRHRRCIGFLILLFCNLFVLTILLRKIVIESALLRLSTGYRNWLLSSWTSLWKWKISKSTEELNMYLEEVLVSEKGNWPWIDSRTCLCF